MGNRTAQEPPYPQSKAELQLYCDRLVAALQKHVPNRLVCVLLCGSWARGEAKPPDSDADITVVLDTVDEALFAALRCAWEASGCGLVNIYGADEVPSMARDALEFYTVNARVLWGVNPFPLPQREDFAADVARAAESLLRYARAILVYPWTSEAEIQEDLTHALGKYELLWGLRCLVAFRTGTFPHNRGAVYDALVGTPEAQLLDWQETLSTEERAERAREIALYLNETVRGWLREIAF